MGNTTMTGPEKDAVKTKLFGEAYSPIQKQIISNKKEVLEKIKGTFEGPNHDKNKHGEPVEEEVKGEGSNKKFKVRVTDKTSGRTYVRFADREKIGSLRANPNIKSVEMTDYGSPYEGEAKKGEQTAATKSGKGLDPVGQEDADVDNDGKKNTKSDKYLLNRRSTVSAAIAKEEVEQIHELLGPEAAGKADKFMKKVQGGMERMGIKINRGEKGTARPSAKTKDTIRQNKQSNEEFSNKEVSMFNNWREEFIVEMGDEIDDDTQNKVKEKKVRNKVIINPKQGGQS
jgi:hypothetical protein